MIVNKIKIHLNNAKGKTPDVDKFIDHLLYRDVMSPVINYQETKTMTGINVKRQREIIAELAKANFLVYETIDERSACKIFLDVDTEYANADTVIRTVNGQEYIYKEKGKWLPQKRKYESSQVFSRSY